jgi:mono/diheme cytochrome c family protein
MNEEATYTFKVCSAVFLTLVFVGFLNVGCGDDEHLSHMGEEEHHGSHWMASPEATQRSNPISATKESIGRGREMFMKRCAVCHGTSARGDGPASENLKHPAADLTKMAGQHSDGYFAWIIANGRGSMPGWKNKLNENEIWDLTNYVQSLKP